MTEGKHDIKTNEDVKLLVDTFYGRVNEDALLSPIFNDVAKLDFAKHMPIMYSFWQTLLFGDMTYQGNPFSHHIKLPIDETHFQRWLELWRGTIDELFEGTKADEAKSRATSIAGIFQVKLKQMGRMKSEE
jgi:hemoglobin